MSEKLVLMKDRIYLDTSVISYLRQEDAPLEMRITNAFWEILKRGEYEVYISDVTVAEISACSEEKRVELFGLLEDIEYIELKTESNEQFDRIVGEIERRELLPPRSINDRRHIAAAIQSRCNHILSWNFKHFIDNENTKRQVNAIAAIYGMDEIKVCTPFALMEKEFAL